MVENQIWQRWCNILTVWFSLAAIPAERAFPPASSPIFFGAALNDPVCEPNGGKAAMTQEAFKNHRVTIVDIDGDHWWPMYRDKAETVAKALHGWIKDVVMPSSKSAVQM